MFDLVSTLRRRQNALQIVPIIVHHVLGTAGALAMTRYRRASFFPCVFLVTELTQLVSVIVAFRSSHEARLVRVCAFLLLRTFTAPLCLTYAWSRLKRDVRARLDKTRDASVDVVHVSARTISDHALITLQSELRALPLAVSIGTAVNVSVIGALNLWWTVLLARSIVRNGSDAAIAAAVAIRE